MSTVILIWAGAAQDVALQDKAPKHGEENETGTHGLRGANKTLLGRYVNAKLKCNQRRDQRYGKGLEWSGQVVNVTEEGGNPLLWGVCVGVGEKIARPGLRTEGYLANRREHGCFDVCPN
ncbi:hypothetical protein T440DRAFT_467776 [Plenodomus tracheiphilus IPT5]|uniref:Uncharacterized protein n=1 Tax=Plenodomus tracheiphilus IPT5 TaxID=1408161 RepID=A0A6A7B877_9PLEO|nr:hypothetical protein T440DRAFT_467776 [Plenodomus tracheiphilus IPT5]